jgi:hypothetical protein
VSRLENIVLYSVLTFCGVAVVGLIVGLVYSVTSAELRCAKRWEGAYQTTFTYRYGCKVVVNGRAIPERAVRDILNAVDIR